MRVGWRLLGVSFDWHFLQGLKMSVAVVIKTLSLFTATKIHFYCPKYELFSVHRICTPKQYDTVCQKSGRTPIFSLMKYEQFILISSASIIIKLCKRGWINRLVTDKSTWGPIILDIWGTEFGASHIFWITKHCQPLKISCLSSHTFYITLLNENTIKAVCM